jgi:coproporphyrinogen III oxidase
LVHDKGTLFGLKQRKNRKYLDVFTTMYNGFDHHPEVEAEEKLVNVLETKELGIVYFKF